MITAQQKKKGFFTLEGVVDNGCKTAVHFLRKKLVLTEYPEKQKQCFYLGKTAELDKKTLEKGVQGILFNNHRDLNVDVDSFVKGKLTLSDVIEVFVKTYFDQPKMAWSLKTTKKRRSDVKSVNLLTNAVGKKVFADVLRSSEVVQFVRSLQAMPPNILNSVVFAEKIVDYLKPNKNVRVRVLQKKQIQDLNMNLLLAVNAASQHEPRVVTMEYVGNPKSRKKLALVGKGICFDAGGYNLKPGKFILGMKYDMSGAAAVVGAMKLVSLQKPSQNVVGVVCLTDNVVSKSGTLPDSVVTAMNGKTVEINNTDAEGRLALADGITLALEKYNATSLVTVATLTGAVLVALGATYTGAWATSDELFKKFDCAAKKANENIWRMPFHSDFVRYMKKSVVADLRNTDYTGMGGSCSAAMFLKEFSQKVPYVHLDIAGTANLKDKPQGVMVKTLFEFAAQRN